MSRITIWTHHITGQMAGTFQQGGTIEHEPFEKELLQDKTI